MNKVSLGHSGFFLRVFASLADGLILSTGMILFKSQFIDVISKFLSQHNPSSPTTIQGAIASGVVTYVIAYAVLILTVSTLYNPIFESTMEATPGKMLFGIKVCDTDGNKIGFGKALLRQVSRFLFVIPALMAFGLASVGVASLAPLLLIISFIIAVIHYPTMLFSSQKQCLHDMCAGTYVIHSRQEDITTLFIKAVMVLGACYISNKYSPNQSRSNMSSSFGSFPKDSSSEQFGKQNNEFSHEALFGNKDFENPGETPAQPVDPELEAIKNRVEKELDDAIRKDVDKIRPKIDKTPDLPDVMKMEVPAKTMFSEFGQMTLQPKELKYFQVETKEKTKIGFHGLMSKEDLKKVKKTGITFQELGTGLSVSAATQIGHITYPIDGKIVFSLENQEDIPLEIYVYNKTAD